MVVFFTALTLRTLLISNSKANFATPLIRSIVKYNHYLTFLIIYIRPNLVKKILNKIFLLQH